MQTMKTIIVVVAVPTHVGKGRFHDCSDKLYSLRHSLGLNEAPYKRKAHRRGGALDSIYSRISFRHQSTFIVPR
jgi:hypothetical protein